MFEHPMSPQDMPLVYDVCHNIAKMEAYEVDGVLHVRETLRLEAIATIHWTSFTRHKWHGRLLSTTCASGLILFSPHVWCY